MSAFFTVQICILICIYFSVVESSCGVWVFFSFREYCSVTEKIHTAGISTDKLAGYNSPAHVPNVISECPT